MSKPWYDTIGYPVKVLNEGTWKNGTICSDYRYDDGTVFVLTEDGIVVWWGDSPMEEFLKPNLPDDNPWIPTKERLPKDSEYARVYMTIKPYTYPETIKGSWSYDKFYYANGKQVQCPVLAWKYLRYPEPYKEGS